MLCCAVLCCAVLCCAVLCCVVLCCGLSCFRVPVENFCFGFFSWCPRDRRQSPRGGSERVRSLRSVVRATHRWVLRGTSSCLKSKQKRHEDDQERSWECGNTSHTQLKRSVRVSSPTVRIVVCSHISERTRGYRGANTYRRRGKSGPFCRRA